MSEGIPKHHPDSIEVAERWVRSYILGELGADAAESTEVAAWMTNVVRDVYALGVMTGWRISEANKSKPLLRTSGEVPATKD